MIIVVNGDPPPLPLPPSPVNADSNGDVAVNGYLGNTDDDEDGEEEREVEEEVSWWKTLCAIPIIPVEVVLRD